MKHLLTAIACCLAVAGSAQFIPQPIGYNPDSNSDGAVGSEDLLSILSLYSTMFDNGDSTVMQTYDVTGVGCLDYYEPIQIDESVDIAFIITDIGSCGTEPSFILPDGFGYKSLVVLVKNEEVDSQINIEGFGQMWLNNTFSRGAFFIRAQNEWFSMTNWSD